MHGGMGDGVARCGEACGPLGDCAKCEERFFAYVAKGSHGRPLRHGVAQLSLMFPAATLHTRASL